MEIRSTKSAKDLLCFLEGFCFKDLPYELWDRYLWLYGELLEPLSHAVSGYELGESRMYTIVDGSLTKGIIFAEFRGESYNLYIDAMDSSAFDAFLSFLIEENLNLASISLRDFELSKRFAKRFADYELVDA